MKKSIKKGFSFGLTSGIITTLGLIIGLYSSTESRLVVISGILIIAIADALSDAAGMHISEEGEKKNSSREIWASTFATFFSKFFFALSFVFFVLFFELTTAVILSIIWGILLITILSYYISKERKGKPIHAIAEHLSITIVVILLTFIVGRVIETFLG